MYLNRTDRKKKSNEKSSLVLFINESIHKPNIQLNNPKLFLIDNNIFVSLFIFKEINISCFDIYIYFVLCLMTPFIYINFTNYISFNQRLQPVPGGLGGGSATAPERQHLQGRKEAGIHAGRRERHVGSDCAAHHARRDARRSGAG